jgi:proteasome lid subunit RPN8/RPN11
MNTEAIKISRKLTNQLLHQAQISPDHEICGLIGSCENIPTTCYPIDNIAENPAQRFLLEPKQQIAAMAAMREHKQQLFAIYHSHPSSPATPSATDIEMAAYPETLYLIISLNTKGVLELRGFRLAQNPPEEVELILSEE